MQYKDILNNKTELFHLFHKLSFKKNKSKSHKVYYRTYCAICFFCNAFKRHRRKAIQINSRLQSSTLAYSSFNPHKNTTFMCSFILKLVCFCSTTPRAHPANRPLNYLTPLTFIHQLTRIHFSSIVKINTLKIINLSTLVRGLGTSAQFSFIMGTDNEN